MEIKESRTGEILVLDITGKLDAISSEALNKELAVVIEKDRNLIINCKGIDYISSSGIRSLLLAAKHLKEKGHFALCELSESVKEVFEIAGLMKVFPIYSQLSEAVEDFSRHAGSR
ncbi:MAG: STAS domain-containing protein [Candidatus Eremiobacteraeota bacterium]|nr:STAS domain-containing protein [Candidatus Eremiobacteraeota bacterium]